MKKLVSPCASPIFGGLCYRMPEPIEPHAVSSYLHGNFIPPNPVIPTDPIVPLAQEVSLLVHEFPAAPVVPLGQAVTDYFHPGDPVVPTTTDGWLLYQATSQHGAGQVRLPPRVRETLVGQFPITPLWKRLSAEGAVEVEIERIPSNS